MIEELNSLLSLKPFFQICLRMDEDRPQSMYENWRELTVPGSKDKKQKRSKKSTSCMILYITIYIN